MTVLNLLYPIDVKDSFKKVLEYKDLLFLAGVTAEPTAVAHSREN